MCSKFPYNVDIQIGTRSLHFDSQNLFSSRILMPVVHSRQENLRQRESENVDGNTRLASDALM